MNTENDNSKPTGEMGLPVEQESACSSGCRCNTAGPAGKTRWIVGVIVLVAAGLLVARAMVKDNGAPTVPASTGFAALPAPKQALAPDVEAAPSDTNAVTAAPKEIAALSELNAVAADTIGVFIFLPAKSETTAKAPMAQIRSAARTMEPQLRGGKVGIFTLKTGSRDYEQIASQMAVPGVLAMVKGRGMSAASGEITETKLIQAFVAASGGSGCGAGGCGPRGCK